MYYFAFVLLALSMLCALAGAAWAVKSLWPRTAPAAGKASRRTSVPGLGFVEKANLCLTGCYIIASAILIYALASYDFSLVYVASYTDRLLPLFYRITAFWAGQAGSMLFWAFSVAICGGLFQLTRSYKSLTPDTRLWYWVFYLGIMSFFGLILVTWNNPFLMNHAVPQDGNGLNPLLLNPGMIFHPPLLFLGYCGFVIPSCLALAQALFGCLILGELFVILLLGGVVFRLTGRDLRSAGVIFLRALTELLIALLIGHDGLGVVLFVLGAVFLRLAQIGNALIEYIDKVDDIGLLAALEAHDVRQLVRAASCRNDPEYRACSEQDAHDH